MVVDDVWGCMGLCLGEKRERKGAENRGQLAVWPPPPPLSLGSLSPSKFSPFLTATAKTAANRGFGTVLGLRCVVMVVLMVRGDGGSFGGEGNG